MTITKEKIKEIYENRKPLNYVGRLAFQSYCKYLVEEEQIQACDVEEFLSNEFIYENYEELERAHNNKVNNYGKLINFTLNVATFYGIYRLFKKFFKKII